MTCAQNNSNIKSKASQRTTLITKHIGSNPNATYDHHMKYHQYPPWQVTSSTDKLKIHGVASLLHAGCHIRPRSQQTSLLVPMILQLRDLVTRLQTLWCNITEWAQSTYPSHGLTNPLWYICILIIMYIRNTWSTPLWPTYFSQAVGSKSRHPNRQ